MSLGDLGNNLRKSGNDAYANQRARILREGEEAKKRMEAVEAQKEQQEISHIRLRRSNLEGHILQLEREIRTEKDARLKADKMKERDKLKNDRLHMEGEIMKIQGRTNRASNIRFNRPNYF